LPNASQRALPGAATGTSPADPAVANGREDAIAGPPRVPVLLAAARTESAAAQGVDL